VSFVDELLFKLLLRIEEIGNIHEELFDSDVRQAMGDAVFYGFIRPLAGYQLPDDFGMFSASANQQVRTAISEYVDSANRRADELGLSTFHQRLAAFQNRSVRTPSERWNDFDEFFGYTNPDSYDENGTVINNDLR
jgi:hypothetical protein